jgi:hypothetical protein
MLLLYWRKTLAVSNAKKKKRKENTEEQPPLENKRIEKCDGVPLNEWYQMEEI